MSIRRFFLFRNILLPGIILMLSTFSSYSQDRFVIADPGQTYYGITQLPNKQFVASGIDSTLVLTQIDTSGNINWTKSYTDTSCIKFIGGSDICSLYDNSVVVSGNRLMSTQPNAYKSVLTRIDSAGNINWSFTSSATGSIIYDVEATKDSCVLVAYYTTQIHIMKLNSQGNILWLKNYSLSGNIVATNDNGFIMYWSDMSYLYINKYDSQGNQSWGGKWTAGASYEFLQWQNLVQCANGGYACIAAITDQTFGNYHDAVFLRLNPNGTTNSVTLLDSVQADWNSIFIYEKANGEFIVSTYGKTTVLSPAGSYVTSKNIISPHILNQINPLTYIAFNGVSICTLDTALATCCYTPQVGYGNTFVFNLISSVYNQIPIPANDTLVPVYLATAWNDSTYYLCSDSHIPDNVQIRSVISPYVCEGVSVPLTLTPPTCFNYQWKHDGVIIPGADDVTFYARDSGYYSCVISNGTGTYETDSFLVVVYPLPPTSLTTSSIAPAFCVNDSVLVYTDSTSVSYLWLPDSSTGPSIYVDSAGIYSVLSTNAYGCSRKELITIREDSIPPAIPVFSDGGTSSCINSLHYFTAGTPVTGYYYRWMQDSILLFQSYINNYLLTLHNSGYYYCIVANGCGNGITDSVYLAPEAPVLPVIQPGTDVEICRGDSVILTTSIGYNYYWRIDYPPNNIFYVSNDTLITDSAQIYKLYYTDSAGCLTITNVVVSLVGPIINNATHSDSLCYEGQPILLDCTPIGGTYMGTAVNNGNFDPALGITGWNSYQYSFTDSTGCIATLNDSIKIYIPLVIPATHSDSMCVNYSPVMLNCLPAGGVYSGSAVDTGYFHPALASAGWNAYTYESTDNLGCSVLFSDSVFVSTCTSLEESFKDRFYFYPNPVKNELVINNAYKEECKVQVYSPEGKLVGQWNLKGNEEMRIPVTFSPGLYLLDVNWKELHTNYQFIKL